MEQTHMSEAEYMYMNECQYDPYEEAYTMYDIKQDRKRRMRELVGRYVVSCDGKSSGKRVFLQDRNVSKGGYWTQYLSNAVGFKDLAIANKNKNLFKYGQPRIYFVDSSLNLKLIK